jgi:hypothetical protein
MYPVSTWIGAGIGLPFLLLAFAPLFGFRTALEGAWYAFLSIGMALVFHGWLQFINFDGSWPWDQPFQEFYSVSKEEDARIWAAVDLPTMTNRDWDDYHRCRDHNVCVRRFARPTTPYPRM